MPRRTHGPRLRSRVSLALGASGPPGNMSGWRTPPNALPRLVHELHKARERSKGSERGDPT